MPLPGANVIRYWSSREIGDANRADAKTLIDQRIRTLRDSQRHKTVPWKCRPVAASAMSFDDSEQRFLLCGSCVGEVAIVDMASPALREIPWKHTTYSVPVAQSHKFLVSGCQFYPVDSGIFVTSSTDYEVRLWDSNAMCVLDKYKNEVSVLDCHWGMPNYSGLIAVALGSACVRLIDPRTRNNIQQMRWKSKFAKCIRWMNSPSNLLLAGSESGDMVVWDIRSAKSELMEVTTDTPAQYSANHRRHIPAKAHNCCLRSIRCSKDGRYVVSMANDKRIHVWDSNTMRLRHSVDFRGEVEGECMSMAELCDEGHELFGFVGAGTDLIVARLTPADTVKAENYRGSNPIVPIRPETGRSAMRKCRRKTENWRANDVRIIHAHMNMVMSTAYRRNYHQVITSSGDGSTLVWGPEADETLSDEKHAEIEEYCRDNYSDED